MRKSIFRTTKIAYDTIGGYRAAYSVNGQEIETYRLTVSEYLNIFVFNSPIL